jgi:hypothetical protein
MDVPVAGSSARGTIKGLLQFSYDLTMSSGNGPLPRAIG